MNLEALVLIVAAIGLGAFLKGVTGMGMPLFGVPVIAAFTDVPRAVAILVMPIVLTNAWQIWEFRHAWRGLRFLPVLVAFGVPGVILGTWFLVSVPERFMSATLAIVVFLYIVLRFFRPDFWLRERLALWLTGPVSFFAGALQGAAGISAPIGVTFIHAMRLPRAAHIFAVSVMFLSYELVHGPALAIAGVMTWPVFLESLAALVPTVIAMALGGAVGRRINPDTFDRAVVAVLALVAVKLLYDSFT